MVILFQERDIKMALFGDNLKHVATVKSYLLSKSFLTVPIMPHFLWNWPRGTVTASFSGTGWLGLSFGRSRGVFCSQTAHLPLAVQLAEFKVLKQAFQCNEVLGTS